MPESVPELSFSERALQFLATEDGADAIPVLFSLLADPEVDDRLKREANYFPYTGTGARELLDDSWYVVYSVDDARNVTIHYIRRRADIDRIIETASGG